MPTNRRDAARPHALATNNLSVIVAALSVVVLAACGGPPAKNPLLIDARTQYGVASSNPDVMRHAAAPLEEAEQHILRAEAMWRDGDEAELIDHEAYIGRQKVRIAIETANLSKAQEAVERAEVERQRVQLDARRIEAERAEERARQASSEAESQRQMAMSERQRAEAARQDAEAARTEAEESLSRAQELARRVEELEAQQTERGLVLTLGDVLFDVGRAELKAGGLRAVEQLTNFLSEYPERSVLIEGHTDNTGSDELNQRLSLQRAEAVRFALLDRGVGTDRIRTRGYGEAYPVANNGTAAGRQANRRVEVVISKAAEVIPERQ